MVCYIDDHCHADYHQDPDKIVQNAINADVKIIVNNGTNIENNRKTLDLAKKYPEIRKIQTIHLEIHKVIGYLSGNKDLA